MDLAALDEHKKPNDTGGRTFCITGDVLRQKVRIGATVDAANPLAYLIEEHNVAEVAPAL